MNSCYLVESLGPNLFEVSSCIITIYIAIVEVLFIWLKVICFIKEAKHIDVRYHVVRGNIVECDFKEGKISTNDNFANMMTKPIPRAKFELCSRLVSLNCKPSWLLSLMIIYYCSEFITIVTIQNLSCRYSCRSHGLSYMCVSQICFRVGMQFV